MKQRITATELNERRKERQPSLRERPEVMAVQRETHEDTLVAADDYLSKALGEPDELICALNALFWKSAPHDTAEGYAAIWIAELANKGITGIRWTGEGFERE